MKISELTAALSRVQQIVGDADVVLKDAVSEAESVITKLGLDLGATGTATEGTLTLTHGEAPPAPVAEEPPPPAEPDA